MARGRSGWMLGAAMALLACAPDAGDRWVTLTVALAGVGRGAVVSSAGPLSCTAVRCSQRVARGTRVKLTARASESSLFSGWSSGCSGTGTCEVVVTEDATIRAGFALDGYWSTSVPDAQPFGLAVTAEGDVLLFASYYKFELGSGPLARDAFLARYAASGELRWRRTFPAMRMPNPTGNALTLNPDGTIVLAGSFFGFADFGLGWLSSAGYEDIFVAAFTPEGLPLWSKRYGGTSSNLAISVTSRGAGTVVVTGWLYESTRFDHLLVDRPDGSGAQAYVLELSTAGEVRTAWGSSFRSGQSPSIAGNARGEVWVTGGVPGAIRPTGQLIKLVGGSPVWTREFKAIEVTPKGVVADAEGNTTLLGYSSGTLDFGQLRVPNNTGFEGLFLARYESDSTLQWVRSWSGTGRLAARALSQDEGGNLNLVGFVRGGTIDLGGGELERSGPDLPNAFFVRYSADGFHRYSHAFSLHSVTVRHDYALYPSFVASGADGSSAVAGAFAHGTVDFGDASHQANERTLFLLRFPPL